MASGGPDALPLGVDGDEAGGAAALGFAGGSTPVAAGGAGGGICQPGGGAISTMLPHFWHSRICPITAASRTLSRAVHVVQVTVKSGMRPTQQELTRQGADSKFGLARPLNSLIGGPDGASSPAPSD